MMLGADVMSKEDPPVLWIAKGQEITSPLIAKLALCSQTKGVRKPITVYIPQHLHSSASVA